MVEKKLDQFKGTLTAREGADGINAAIRNARRLADDAELLLRNERFASAASLAILSIEESGKETILRGIVTSSGPEEAKPLWREYRSHTKKNVMWLVPQLVAEGARRLDDFGGLFSEESDHSYLLEKVKQIGLYTDCLGKRHWSEPAKVISEDLARVIVKVAGLLTSEEPVSETEIELWVKNVGPHLRGPAKEAKAAIEKWYEEMQYLGLKPAGVNKMKRFIREGLEMGKDAEQREVGG